MADTSNSLFEDPNASHPLDLLINAISGSGEEYQIPPEAREGEFNLEQLLNSGAQDEAVDKGKRKREDETDVSDDRRAKIAKCVTSHIIEATNLRPEVTSTRQRYTPSTFSTIEVWHPKSGQKSYGKERRMLNPPPILRVTGPLLPVLTKATVSTTFLSDSVGIHTPLSSQTQRIPLTQIPSTTTLSVPASLKSKRLEKEEKRMKLREQASRYGFGQTLPFERRKMAEKERQALRDGLSFPGLWVGEGIGRTKEFRLELSLGFPQDQSQNATVTAESTSTVDPTLQSGDAQDTGVLGEQTAEQAVSTDIYSGPSTLGDTPEVPQTSTLDEFQPPSSDLRPDLQPDSHTFLTGPEQGPQHWASFTSAPLNVVSKPSQKTAKARSMASCFTVNDSFSLWVRIHGQTVRTKYMKLDASEDDEPHLTTRTGQWTPFRFEVIERAATADPSERSTSGRKRSNAQPANILTYGSIGCLVDSQSGIRTEPMRLIKIEKNEHLLGTDHGHPVSDLQRVGFIRLVDGNNDYATGGRWYLSAPGARLGGAEAEAALPLDDNSGRSGSQKNKAKAEGGDPQTLDSVPESVSRSLSPGSGPSKQKKRKTKRFALAEAVIAEDAGGSEFALTWTKASRYEAERTRISGKERVSNLELCEKVEDWMCWTLGGVEKFSHSFFNGIAHSSDDELLPLSVIDPIPQPLAPPSFRPESNTLDLTLSEFFSSDVPDYEVYLGPLGPLSTSTYRSMAPVNAGPDDGISQHFEATPYFDNQQDTSFRSVRSDFPCNRHHVIVVIDMPRAEEIIRTMQECFAEARYQATSTLQTVSGEPTQAEGWLTTNEQNITTNSNPPESQGLASHGETVQDQPSSAVDKEFSTGDLSSGDLGLEQMLNSSQHPVEGQHDVDDIAAVLAAHASENDFSLAQIDDAFLNSNLDPSLQDPQPQSEGEIATMTVTASATAAAASTPNPNAVEFTEQTLPEGEQESVAPPPLSLTRPQQEDKNVEMVPLPVLLIRKTDGVGFGAGTHVAAERVDSRAPGEKPRWGLRVVLD